MILDNLSFEINFESMWDKLWTQVIDTILKNLKPD